MLKAIIDTSAKVSLMSRVGWYKTLSGDWRDSHGMCVIYKKDFNRMTLLELKKEILNNV